MDNPEQRGVAMSCTDLQVATDDRLAGPVYDPNTERARLSKLDDGHLHLSSIQDVRLPKLVTEFLNLRAADRQTWPTTSEGVFPNFIGRPGHPLVSTAYASGVD
jgi:hypothetical protein